MKIQVTKKDIEESDRLRLEFRKGQSQGFQPMFDVSSTCPIALACSRTLNTPLKVSITSLVIRGQLIRLPLIARNFIKHYDIGKFTVKPIEFELEVPNGLLKPV